MLCNLGDRVSFLLSFHFGCIILSCLLLPVYLPLVCSLNQLTHHLFSGSMIFQLKAALTWGFLSFRLSNPPFPVPKNILIIHSTCTYHAEKYRILPTKLSYHLESLIFFSVRNICFIFTSKLFLFFSSLIKGCWQFWRAPFTIKLRVKLPLAISTLFTSFPTMGLIPPKIETIQDSTSPSIANTVPEGLPFDSVNRASDL